MFIFLPVPDGTMWWTAQVSAAEPPPGRGIVGLAELTRLFATEPQAAAVLGAATVVRPANLGQVLKPVRRRHSDRTVLIGDAAHPVGAGQGASIAMEDAVVLARHLASGRRRRDSAGAGGIRPRAPAAGGQAGQDGARQPGRQDRGPVATGAELIMPHVFSRFYENATGWLYDFDPGALPVTRAAGPDRPAVRS